MLVGLLAENNLAYRGSLKTMCEWLGLKSSSNNNKAIKDALCELEKKEYIFYKIEGRTYHISISNKGLKNKRIVRIRKIWIEAFKHYNRDDQNNKIDSTISIDWIKIVRVFVFLYTRTPGTITLKEIAADLNISEETVRVAINAILACALNGISVDKKVSREKYKDKDGKNIWITKGLDISIMISFM